jgi:hypothetical protein
MVTRIDEEVLTEYQIILKYDKRYHAEGLANAADLKQQLLVVLAPAFVHVADVKESTEDQKGCKEAAGGLEYEQ